MSEAIATKPALVRKPRTTTRCTQQLWLIDVLAQSFAVCTHYVSRNARRLYAASELPPALERVARSLQRGPRTWLAWTEENKTRFLIAELPANADRAAAEEALRLFFYDEDGRYLAKGEWEMRPGGHWALCKR